jgi:phosphohistidine phosphatase SixA/8-oxo-dGTP pyrophosphatase MutT (NUDIX family)
MPVPQPRDVLAAGAVVTRKGKQVLLVHRPTYDDWSFPKGKLDRGEHATVAAVREVDEETGVHIRLGRPLSGQRYSTNASRMKSVAYWQGWAVGDDDVSGYLVNHEIDEVVWVPYDQARKLLTYPRDQETLKEALKRPKKTRALIVLRHASARSRKSWRRDDRRRPLLRSGELQAERLVPLLAAYDATRVVSSPNTRCVQTVQPYADTTGWKLEQVDGLSEEDATAKTVLETVDDLLDGADNAVLCTHRPVLPAVFDALGVRELHLEPGGLLVVHHRKGKVIATEHHSRP